MPDDLFPVTWTGRRAIVSFPGQVGISNVDQLRDRLLSVINRGATVLIADMTSTVSCDHAAVDAIARAYQRAAASGNHFTAACQPDQYPGPPGRDPGCALAVARRAGGGLA